MVKLRPRRLALWGGTLAVSLAPALASAQDGQPPVGPSTTAPETNKDNPKNPPGNIEAPKAKRPDQVLPAVPETASDPAPLGTRGVRVDLPKTAVPPAAPAANRLPAGVKVMEGVVTRLSKPGKDVAGETLRIRVDPSLSWENYAAEGPGARINHSAAKPSADRKDQPAPAEAAGTNIVLTRRTYVFAHARTADGIDLNGAATESSPSDRRRQSDALNAHVRAGSTGRDPEASFTNIREGAYVLVRYRADKGLNQALNVSLIEMPLDPSAGDRARKAASDNTSDAPRVPVTPVSPGALPR